MKHEVLETIKKVLEIKFEELWSRESVRLSEQLKRELTDRDRNDFYNQLTFDLTKAIGNYILPSDKLIEYKVVCSGRYVIQMLIERDNNKFHFETELIVAGGYNIQCLHNRYICKGLPKLTTNVYLEELKRIKKIESYKKELKRLNENIIKYNEEIEASKKLDRQYFLNQHKENFKYELVKKNFKLQGKDISKDEFDKLLDKYTETDIKRNNESIEFRRINIKNNLKDIEKINKKIQSLEV